MRMQSSLDWVSKDEKSLVRFGALIQKMWRNLSLIINGQINFGDGTSRNNIDGVWANVVAPAAPNTDFVVTHNLGRIPVGYWVMEKDRACDVYTGSVAATSSQITLRATVASAVLRLFIVCVLLSLFGVEAKAQTTVNLTVQDGGGTLWNGPWTVSILPPSGVVPPPTPTIISGGGSLTTQTGTLSAGTASISLPANTNIAPSGTHWLFNVCFNATGPCFSQQVTVSLSSPQSLTLTPPAPTPNSGGTGGGNGVGNGAAPAIAIYVSSFCPATDPDAICIQTFGDTVQIQDASWSSAGTTLTTNSTVLTAAVVGMSIMGWQTCATDQTSATTGSGQLSSTALLTINSFTDSHHVVLSTTPGATTTFSGSNPQGGCAIYGHLDETAFSAVDTLLASSTLKVCPQIIFTNSGYFLTNPHLFTNPLACQSIGPGIGQNYGNTILAAGMHVEARGPGAATFYIAPSFPNGNACTNSGGTVLGASSGCWAVTVMGQWTGVRFDGGSNSLFASLNGLKFMVATVSQLRDVTFTNIGAYNISQMICLELNHDVILRQVNISGCGQIGISVPTNTGNSIGYGVAVENDDQSLKVVGPDAFSNTGAQFTCFYCNFLQLNPTISAANINSRAGSITLIGSQVRVFVSSTTNGLTGYICNTTTGCVLTLVNTSIQYQFGGASNNNSGINCAVICTTYISAGSQVLSQSSGSDYTDVAGSQLWDRDGTTTWSPRLTVNGTNHHVEAGTCTFAASTTCTVTFNRSFGASTPAFLIPPNIVGTATTLTVSALSATSATITASASNSSGVNWSATL